MGMLGSVSIALVTVLFNALQVAVQADTATSYIVGLRNAVDGQTYCMGALISSKYVLTSNHCYPTVLQMYGNGPVYDNQYAVIGSTYLKGANDGETIMVSSTRTRHPDFNETTNENDYLLLKLKTPSTRKPVTLMSIAHMNDGLFDNTADTTVIGWGTGPNTGYPVSSQLTITHMMVLQQSECSAFMKVYNSELCLQGADKAATCKVDYGSIVLATTKNGDQILGGVINNVVGCGRSGVPLKLNKVEQVLTWIASVASDLLE